MKILSKKTKLKVAYIIEQYTTLCWSDLVSWHLGYKSFYRVVKNADHVGCKIEAEEQGTCYCGKYISEEYKRKDKEDVIKEMEEVEDLPF